MIINVRAQYISRMTGVSEFVCVGCNKQFKNGASLRSHRYSQHHGNASAGGGRDGDAKDSLAAKLFSRFEKGRTPVQVIAELQIKPEVVKGAFEQYTELADMYDAFVRRCYDEGWGEGHKAGVEEARTQIARLSRMHFLLPCPICGDPMNFSEDDRNWNDKEYPVLLSAFQGWQHASHKTG